MIRLVVGILRHAGNTSYQRYWRALSEDGVAVALGNVTTLAVASCGVQAWVEVGNRNFGDKELRTVSVRSGIRIGEHASLAEIKARGKLVFKGIPRITLPVGQRIATLDHEVGDHAMKYGSVVERLAVLLGMREGVFPILGAGRQSDKVIHCGGNLVLEEFAGE